MVHLKLLRVAKSIEGTYGVFINNLDNKPICLSLERSWQDNKPFISCIPLGTYKLVKYRKPGQFQLMDVKNRTYILIHVANYVHQLAGCIAPGSSFSKSGVQSSGKAINKLGRFFDQVCDLDDKETQFINLIIME